MMSLLHLAFSSALLVVLASTVVMAWAARNKAVFVRKVAIVVLVLGIINALCIAYHGVRYEAAGYCNKPCPMMSMQKNKQCPMMNTQKNMSVSSHH